MNIDNFDTDKEILIIAEIGNNHEGNFALAQKLVLLAAEAGADAVKFQTFQTQYYVSAKDTARFNRLKSFELTSDQFIQLQRTAEDAGLLFISTPFDLQSALFLKDLVSAYKISSGDNTFYPLLACVAQTGKPIIMSGGLADIEQLKYSQAFIHNIWRSNNVDQALAILHCVTLYPVSPQEANLAAISRIRRELHCTTGYSDHTLGIDAAIVAAALGATIIEKHFTLDKNYSSFRDHQLSADQAELKLLIKKVREVSVLLGSGIKAPLENERNMESAVRRSIVAKSDLPAGTILSSDDITWIRPGNGLLPGKENMILGKMLSRAIAMGETILMEDVITPVKP
ncbi:MAG: N-acetylneuraminate synthase family protein [Smithellaceae bacterium]